ncbi:Ribosomal protein S12 methylthiotransferase RimO [Candidatus Tiddalikarchaeum anstoanum]|nr:Ribosomal protein S12 methylthiotransferase RimO [Candidatus Tiddalikarchaeum anstoanum]
MNILLVYPKYPDTFWGFKTILNLISKKTMYPPLGLLTVASMLPKEWNKKLIDENIRDLKDEDIMWADMVFISAMLVQKESSQEIINKCKGKNKVVVAGGPAFTMQHEKFDNVDHFVLNEAEVTLPLFLKDLKKGCAKKIYTSDIKPDITNTPIPSWNLINFKDYGTMSLQYSRGCPFNCEFCDIIVMNGRVPRTKTPKQFLSEVESLYNAGWRGGLFIVDDNFIGNKVEVKKMLRSLIEWQKVHKYPFTLLTEASTNLADDEELMNLMITANFNKVFLGIETPKIKSLKECGKFQNVKRDLVESVKIIHKHGMQVMGGFIVGFDNDTKDIFKSQIDFIRESSVVNAMVGLLTVIPQTRLWYRLKAEGRLVNDWTGENTDGVINFIPKLGKESLLKGYKKILSTIYSPIEYYKRIEQFIKEYNPTSKARISLNNILTLIKSNWYIGVLSSDRWLYWKLLTKTFFTKIKAFPVAVELAICRLHFEKITNKVLSS